MRVATRPDYQPNEVNLWVLFDGDEDFLFELLRVNKFLRRPIEGIKLLVLLDNPVSLLLQLPTRSFFARVDAVAEGVVLRGG